MFPSEDDLQQGSLGLLEELGWARMYAPDIKPGGAFRSAVAGTLRSSRSGSRLPSQS